MASVACMVMLLKNTCRPKRCLHVFLCGAEESSLNQFNLECWTGLISYHNSFICFRCIGTKYPTHTTHITHTSTVLYFLLLNVQSRVIG